MYSDFEKNAKHHDYGRWFSASMWALVAPGAVLVASLPPDQFRLQPPRVKRHQSPNQHVLRRMLNYLRPYTWWLVLLVGFVLIASAVSLALPMLMGSFIDAIGAEHDIGIVPRVIMILGSATVLHALLSAFGNYMFNNVANAVLYDLRTEYVPQNPKLFYRELCRPTGGGSSLSFG